MLLYGNWHTNHLTKEVSKIQMDILIDSPYLNISFLIYYDSNNYYMKCRHIFENII